MFFAPVHHGYWYLCTHNFPDGSVEFKGVVVVHREDMGSPDVLLCVWMLRGDLQNNVPAVNLWIQNLKKKPMFTTKHNFAVDIIAQIFHRNAQRTFQSPKMELSQKHLQLKSLESQTAAAKVLLVLALPLWRWVFL